MNRTNRLIMAVENALRAPSVHNTQPCAGALGAFAQVPGVRGGHLAVADRGRRGRVARGLEPAPGRH
jgi:hypothetical protein